MKRLSKVDISIPTERDCVQFFFQTKYFSELAISFPAVTMGQIDCDEITGVK